MNSSAVSVVEFLCFVGEIACGCDTSSERKKADEGSDDEGAAGHRE